MKINKKSLRINNIIQDIADVTQPVKIVFMCDFSTGFMTLLSSACLS